MRSRRLLSGLAVALCLALPAVARADDEPVAPAAGPETTSPAWAEPAFLGTHLGKACDAVEAVTGRSFPERPKARITTEAEMVEILLEEMSPIFRNLGVSTDEAIESTCKLLAGALTAKYEPKTNTVHVQPKVIVDIAKKTGLADTVDEDLVRILLAHEATHALDFQLHPSLDEERRTRKTQGGVQAVGAMVEGHAQLVAEEIADRWELRKAFQAFTALVFAKLRIDDPALALIADVQMAEHKFAYGQGHRFMKAVAEARGREGIEAALRSPPATVREVERPEEWLAPDEVPEAFDVEVVFEATKPLFGGSTPARIQVKRMQLEVVFGALPAADRDPLIKAFDDGWVEVGKAEGISEQVTVGVIVFDTPEDAAKYPALMEKLARLRDEQMKPGGDTMAVITKAEYDDRIGTERQTAAIYIDKTVEVAAAGVTTTVVTIGAAASRCAVEIMFTNPEAGREVNELVMLRVIAALEGKPLPPLAVKTREAPPPAAQEGVDIDALRSLVAAFRASPDRKTKEVLGQALLMTREELRSVLREGEDADAFARGYEHRWLAPDPDVIGIGGGLEHAELAERVFDPGDEARTQVDVWRATTEELAAAKEGSVAWAEFPTGMARFAATVAAPGRVWYVIEFVEPGQTSGRQVACFTKLPDRFVLLNDPWRALPR